METINYTNLRIAKWSTNAIENCNYAIQNLELVKKNAKSDYQKDTANNAIDNLTLAISWLTDIAKDAIYNIENETSKEN